MANFNTHFSVGTGVSAVLASSSLTFGLASPIEALGLWFAGTIGGMLPDIDADDSKAIRVLFALFAGFLAGLWLVLSYQQVSLVTLWLGAGAIFIALRFILMPLFERFSVHRGSIHSLLFIAMVMLITMDALYLLNFNALFSWLAGFFLAMGCLVHLLLDEIYSVDISNARIKRSFGSALKLADFDYPWVTLAQLIAVTVLVFFTPPIQALTHAFSQIGAKPHTMQLLPSWLIQWLS